MTEEAENPPITGEPLTLEFVFYSDLTVGAKRYFNCAVHEYAEKLTSESRNIEQMEHTGDGAPEITAAHVEEAKWVLIRRLRRSTTKGKWPVVCRIGQTLAATVIGIGASNFSKTWGSVICLLGVVLGSLLLVIEREISRDL